MGDDATRAELRTLFKDAVAPGRHDDVMAECLSMLRVFGLSPQDLFFKYEAFLLARPAGLRSKLSVFTLDVARDLRTEIQRESQAKAVAAATPTTEKVAGVRRKAGTGIGGGMDLGGFLDNYSTPVRKGGVPSRLSNAGNNANLPSPAHSTPSRTPTGASASAYRPANKLAPPSATPVGKSAGAPSSPVSGAESPNGDMKSTVQPFRNRPQPLSLLETLNPHLTAGTGAPAGSRPRVSLTATTDPKDWDYRYMFEKMSKRSEALDEQIDEFGEVIREAYGLGDLGDPGMPSEEDIYAVGRILSPPTDTAKASANALYIQSSRVLGGGKVIPLRFAPQGKLKVRGGAPGVRGFGVFPGALVCVKGRNGGGNAFVVDEVLMPPPSALPVSSKEELLDFQQGEKLAGLPMSVHVAAGPYTLDSDLLYEPFDALIDVACDERPDVLILMGPFVDASHPHIQSGRLEISPAELFRKQIASRLARLHDASPATIVVLIPSVRDMISRHAAFPQAMLDKEGLGLAKKVRMLPNPCTLSINEVVIGLASPDVLFHLRREEVFQRAEEAEPDTSAPVNPNPQGDAMANLVRHILGQRTFYPLFPAPEVFAADINLDVTHWHQLRMGDTAPDILVLPSKLKHFSKVVDSTLVVNPGHLSRTQAPGTFAKLTVHPSDPKSLEGGSDGDVDMDGGFVEHEVYARARSEVWRI